MKASYCKKKYIKNIALTKNASLRKKINKI